MAKHATRVSEIRCRVVQARVQLAAEDPAALADVDVILKAALQLIERIGARGEEPFVRLELAELARRRGDEAAAQCELREAHRLFTEMGATGHAERLAKELGS